MSSLPLRPGLAPTQTPSEPFVWPVRVYWEDTDAGGVVFYANYLRFLERARTEWLRTLGFGQEALRTDPGVLFVVAELHLQYRASARLDDELQVSVVVRERGAASLLMTQEVRKNGALLVAATVKAGCVDARTMRPTRIPAVLARML